MSMSNMGFFVNYGIDSGPCSTVSPGLKKAPGGMRVGTRGLRKEDRQQQIGFVFYLPFTI